MPEESGQADAKACYIYGIVPADVELDSGVEGVGDPPGEVRLVQHGEIAALVSEIDVSRPLGRPEDLMAHQQLVDLTAQEVPVLPLRFGAVVANDEAVTEELLGPHQDEFTAALRELEGRAQFVIKGRYVQDAVLNEVLSENEEARQLRDEIRSVGNEDATRDARIRLGELINQAISAKRDTDTRQLGEVIEGHCVSSNVRDPSHEEDAVHVAVLVDTDRQQELEQALEQLAGDWEGRVTLRLLGPMAAYDFIATMAPAG